MSEGTARGYAAHAQYVAAAKEAWRRRALAMTWEQKIAAIVRMRERQAAIRRARVTPSAVGR